MIQRYIKDTPHITAKGISNSNLKLRCVQLTRYSVRDSRFSDKYTISWMAGNLPLMIDFFDVFLSK